LLAETHRTYGDQTPTIMLTAVDERETAVRALGLGAYGYILKPFEAEEVVINVLNALERRRLALLSRDYAHRLEREVRARTDDVREREEELVLRLMSASEYRDDETGSHIRRIGLYCAELADKMGWEREKVDAIRLAGAMHDIGKIGVPDHVLQKPGKLTPEEFEIIKTHTRIGARILSGTDIPLLRMAAEIALSHHERWDGGGYPNGLAGPRIPLVARIAAIADVYDALISPRVYRPALPEEKALEIIRAERGKHFDPAVVDCFLECLPALRHIREVVTYVDAASPPDDGSSSDAP